MAATTEKSPFLPAPVKLKIVAVDKRELQVVAQYNPREIQISQSFGWHQHQSPGQTTVTTMLMEFGGVQPSTTQVELLFDGFESNGMIRDSNGSSVGTVEQAIATLKQLASVQDPFSRDAALRVPYNVIVIWGKGGFPNLQCVIESLATKYTMIGPDGRVLRATCTVNLKEAILNPDVLRDAARREDKAILRAQRAEEAADKADGG